MHQTNELYTRLATEIRGVDYDNFAGMQCTDIVFDLTGNYCNNLVSGNAIDLLNSARAKGYNVLPGNADPQAGDIFVMSSVIDGIDYGHTGYIWQVNIDGTLETVEQNVGRDANLYYGTPAQYMHRDRGYILGYIRPDYQK